MWQAVLSKVPDAANNEKDLGSILVVETGAAGERGRDRTENKTTMWSKVHPEDRVRERTRDRCTSDVALA